MVLIKLWVIRELLLETNLMLKKTKTKELIISITKKGDPKLAEMEKVKKKVKIFCYIWWKLTFK